MTITEAPIWLATAKTLTESFLGERSALPKAKRRLTAEIEATLPEIKVDPGTVWRAAISERFCDFLPRTLASVTTYCLITDKRYSQLSGEGRDASRLFWQVGHKQDDIIDDPSRIAGGDKILREVFNGEGIGHRKTLALLYKKIDGSPELKAGDKHYLRLRIKSWFDFLDVQEKGLTGVPESQFGFGFCRRYREEQNMMAGRAVCALLNWSDCQTPVGLHAEITLPKFSYMSQIIDDVGDLPEDMAARRPSFAIGVLNENPQEKVNLVDTIREHNVKKMTYKLLKDVAPESTMLLDELFEGYRAGALEMGGERVGLILDIAKMAYSNYSKLRDVIYKIDPAWATF